MKYSLVLTAAVALSLVSACKEDAASVPQAVTLSDEALGHYCQMYVADHPGPKAQIFVSGLEAPLWFSQVSDARAFLFDPEREGDILAVYVSDMGKAESWTSVGVDNWTLAEGAVYLIESSQIGGMGTPEAIPFADRATAEAELARLGGQIVGWDEISEDYVRPDWDMRAEAGHAHDEAGQDTAGTEGQ